MEMNEDKFNAIDTYIAKFPEDVQKTLNELRRVIKTAAPEAEEKISYQIPTFVLEGNLVHFAAYKNHIGFYPTPGAIEKFKEDLAGFETSKGALRFPLSEPVPYDLVKRMVIFRVKENLQKAEAKGKKKKQ